MAVEPKSSWGWVEALLHSIYDQADAEAVHLPFDRVVHALHGKLPAVDEHLDTARADILAFTASPKGDLALIALVRRLHPTGNFCLVTFDDSAQLVEPAAR